MVPTLHIYGQYTWHGEAVIVGDVAGLTVLKRAVDEALAAGSGGASAFVTDGEGYDVIVARTDEAGMEALAHPYTDEAATGGNDRLTHPSRLPAVRAVRDRLREECERRHAADPLTRPA